LSHCTGFQTDVLYDLVFCPLMTPRFRSVRRFLSKETGSDMEDFLPGMNADIFSTTKSHRLR